MIKLKIIELEALIDLYKKHKCKKAVEIFNTKYKKSITSRQAYYAMRAGGFTRKDQLEEENQFFKDEYLAWDTKDFIKLFEMQFNKKLLRSTCINRAEHLGLYKKKHQSIRTLWLFQFPIVTQKVTDSYNEKFGEDVSKESLSVRKSYLKRVLTDRGIDIGKYVEAHREQFDKQTVD